jgi:hypothetical protein
LRGQPARAILRSEASPEEGMAAYIIAEVEVTDPETYQTYRAQTPGVVARRPLHRPRRRGGDP